MEPCPLTAPSSSSVTPADLYRARPAVWSAVMHRADQLAVTGVSGSEAYRQALTELAEL